MLRLGRTLALLSALLAGCAQQPIRTAPAGPQAAFPEGSVSLITHGWHTDIALPADEATGPLAGFRLLFPGARTLVFGYGKRTFMIAPVHTLDEWIIGPFPGPAAVEVSAVSSDAATAYGARYVMTVPLPPGGAARLSGFLWNAIAKDRDGRPDFIAQGNWPGALFYEAASRYDLTHTCNTWSAQALQAAGLPIRPEGIVFSGPLDAAVRRLTTPETRTASKQ